MPIGKDSVKRAVTAKKVAKPEFETTEYNMVEVSVADISYRAAKACPALVESVKENGVILPVVVIKDGDSLKLLDGAKRLNALKELKIIDGENGPYGLYVLTVDGETHKYEESKMFWELSVDGTPSPYGIDKVKIQDGEHYSFSVES